MENATANTSAGEGLAADGAKRHAPESRDGRAPTRREFIKYTAGITAGGSLLPATKARAQPDEIEPTPIEVDSPIIDVHAHVGYPSRLAWIPDWIDMDYESMKRHQRVAGIARSFISDTSLYPKPYFEAELLKRCNSDSSLRMWATYVSWAGLYPGTGEDPIVMLEAALKEERIVGAKVDLISGVCARASLEMLNKYLGEEPAVTFDLVRDGDPLFEICQAAGKPLMCHADLAASAHRAERIVEMANRHPKVNVIIAHIGLGLNCCHFGPEAYLEKLLTAREAKNRNVYVDTSIFSLGFCGHVEDLACKLGSDRMLFGSDSPAKSAAALVGRIRDAEMDTEHKENIFHGTAEELFSR